MTTTEPTTPETEVLQDYVVYVHEIHIQAVRVQALSKADAITRVAGGDGEYGNNALDYSETLDTDTWTAEEDF